MTKDNIFAATNGGLDIIEHYLGKSIGSGNKRASIKSLFRDENNASANVYYDTTKHLWYYKDFGDTEPRMNGIDLIMKKENCDFKTALDKAADLANLPVGTLKKAEEMPEIVLRPDAEKVSEAWLHMETPFHIFATKTLHIPLLHLRKWNVGGLVRKGVKHTSFVFQDHAGQYVNIKNMVYGENGKRNRDIPPVSLKGVNPNEVYRFCLYGEHLLTTDNADVAVIVVESEKTAVLASWFYPQFYFLASRGQNGANANEYAAININNGRPVIVLPDADPVRKVPKAYKVLKELGANVHLLDLMPERTDKSDLADYIVEGLRPEISVPKADGIPDKNGNIRWISQVPDWATEEKGKEGKAKAEKKEVQKQEKTQKSQWEAENPYLNCIPKEAFDEPGNDPKKDLLEYGFFAWKNQYWKLVNKSGDGYDFKPEAFSNFTMKILFRMESKTVNRRLIELENNMGRKKTLSVETKMITGLSQFQEVTEGMGNFMFWGSRTEHRKLKSKWLAEELDCIEVDVLGQNTEGFYAFCNGIYKDGTFIETDANGIINLPDLSIYIPAANKTFAKSSTLFVNDKRIKHIPNNLDFKTWNTMHGQVFGNPSMIATLFGMACLFSDIVYSQVNFFPMLFLYGEGGSGKGELIRSIQYLFGKPQDPLHLSNDANTDKAKVREMAQFRNIVICLEEYRNGNEKTVNLLKGIWDRFPAKRAQFNSGYGTESVPINSGVMVTGNDYPNDDPLLQRLTVLELNKNQRTQAQTDAFYNLKKVQEEGITSITLELLNHREFVAEHFRAVYLQSLKEIREELRSLEITDRMAGNLAVMDAFYRLFESRLDFSFRGTDLRFFMHQSMKKQAAKQNSGSEVQRFWDVLQGLAAEGKLTEGVHLKLSGNELFLRFVEVYALYMVQHRNMYNRPGLDKQTLLDKLQNSGSYRDSKTTRINGIPYKCHVFDYSATGCNLSHLFTGNPEFADSQLFNEQTGEVTPDNPLPF